MFLHFCIRSTFKVTNKPTFATGFAATGKQSSCHQECCKMFQKSGKNMLYTREFLCINHKDITILLFSNNNNMSIFLYIVLSIKLYACKKSIIKL